MTRYFAFLRAVNVGGRTARMEDLRRIFRELGCSGVETFLASGNIVFATPKRDAAALEAVIAGELRRALGYEVVPFLRTARELACIAAYRPFPRPAVDAAAALNIAFLAETLDAEAARKLMALKTEIDDFSIRGREVYWLCRRKQSKSTFSNAALEKATGRRTTLRTDSTVQRLVAKYAGAR